VRVPEISTAFYFIVIAGRIITSGHPFLGAGRDTCTVFSSDTHGYEECSRYTVIIVTARSVNAEEFSILMISYQRSPVIG
jgi:hypothetical protein